MNNLKVLCLLLTTLLAISTKGADALVSKYLTTVEYISSKKVILNVYKEVTVYNERGRNLSNFIVSYDPDKPIKKMSAQLLDGNGKLVKSYKMKDIHDISAYTESTLFHEFRHKQIEVIYPSYPYTAILEYTQEYNEFISLPGWLPQEDYGIGVLYASYSVIYNNQTPIRFMHDNLGDPVKSEPKEGVFQLFWEIKNAPPLEKEPFSAPLSRTAPSVAVVPECFTYKGVDGCYTSWNSYGSWVSSMVKGQDRVPEQLCSMVTQLTKDLDNKIDKVQAIYKFMQNSTRYVSIQLGIGGFRPASAQEVFQNGWGDCKALVNYTKALLKIVGIDSYYCEIGIDYKSIIHDSFPSPSQTNHVILAIPDGRDTLWLECTNSRLPFGYIPYSLQNQKVLWVDEANGTGRLVKTISPGPSFNKRDRVIDIDIDSSGNASGKMTTVVTGGELEWLFPEIWLAGQEKNDIILRKYNSPGFRLVGAEFFVDENSAYAKATEVIEFTVGNFASRTGSRIFLKSNLFPSISQAPAQKANRINNVVTQSSFCHTDTLYYRVPEGFAIEYLPKPCSLTSEYGTITMNFTSQNNNGHIITITRTISINKFNKQPEHYNPFIKFLTTATTTDYIILTNNPNCIPRIN